MNFARDFSITKTVGGNYASNAHKSAVLDAVRKTYSDNLILKGWRPKHRFDLGGG